MKKGTAGMKLRPVGISFIGNGFHAPSIMLFFVLLLQVMQGEGIPTLRIPSEEMHLRNKLRGTVWEPGFTIPGILQGADIVLP